MTADNWLAPAALLLLLVIGLLIRHADFFVATDPDEDDGNAQEAVDSCNAALHECEPTVRRVRAGS